MIFKSQYRRIVNDKSAGSSQNRRRQFKNFHVTKILQTKILQSNQSQDTGLREISKIFNR